MLRRFSKSTELRALLIMTGFTSILALLLFSQVIPARSAPGLQPAAQVLKQQAGDPERGRMLFMGQAHLENDGPPCMSCHNVNGGGILGGGTVGPDLSGVAARYSEEGLASAFAEIPWPSMISIFTEHPLTPAEQADLRAFLMTPGEAQQNYHTLVVIGFGLLGCAAAAGFFGFMYRRRLRGVRQALVAQAHLSRRSK